MFHLKMPRRLSAGTIVLLILGAAITGFTSLKTIDLLQFTMPPDQQGFAWFGWACFEAGLAAWTFWHGHAKRDQRTIAMVMVIFNLAAVLVAFTADTILVQVRRGGLHVDLNILTWAIIIAVCVVAAANLSAIIATKLYDPEARAHVRKEEYAEALQEAEEQAQHQIELARLKQIAQNAQAIAPQIGYQQGLDWQAQMYARYALPGMQPPALPPHQKSELDARMISLIDQALAERTGVREAMTGQPPAFVPPSTLDYHPPDGDWNKVFPEAGARPLATAPSQNGNGAKPTQERN